MCQFAWWTEGTKIKLFGWMYPSSNLQVHYTPLEKRRAQSDVMLRKEKDISEGAALLSFIQHSTIRSFWVVSLSLWKWSLFLPFTSSFLADTNKKILFVVYHTVPSTYFGSSHTTFVSLTALKCFLLSLWRSWLLWWCL